MTAISGFHHVKLPVTDVQRSGDWYERVLGLRRELRFEEDGQLRGLALLHPSGVQLASGTTPSGPGPPPGSTRRAGRPLP